MTLFNEDVISKVAALITPEFIEAMKIRKDLDGVYFCDVPVFIDNDLLFLVWSKTSERFIGVTKKHFTRDGHFIEQSINIPE